MAAAAWTTAQRGLVTGLAACLAFILAPLLGLFVVLFMLLAVAALSLLSGDAQRRGGRDAQLGLLGLVAVVGGFLLSLLTNFLGQAALQRGDLPSWAGLQAVYLVAEVLVAAAFWLGAQHLASSRSRTLLAVALGAGAATSLMAAVQAQGAAGALVAEGAAQASAPGSAEWAAWLNGALGRFYETTAGANQAKAIAFILYAWAYATILGRLRDTTAKDPWSLPK